MNRSPLALCHCGKPLQLWVTRSPMSAWEFLVVERCPEHIRTVQGVALAENVVIEDEPEGYGI